MCIPVNTVFRSYKCVCAILVNTVFRSTRREEQCQKVAELDPLCVYTCEHCVQVNVYTCQYCVQVNKARRAMPGSC